VTFSGAMSSLVWFIAIIAMIPVALWLLKRTPMGGAGAGQRTMRSIAALPLSNSQRIVTVEVGQGAARRWLVLGVTAQSITTLHTMEPQEEPNAMGAEAFDPSARTGSVGSAFAQLLGKLRQDRGTDGR